MTINEITHAIIAVAIKIHRRYGPGLLESAYQACMRRELELQGIPFEYEMPLPLEYEGMKIDCAYRLDLLVCGQVVVELKSIAKIQPIHEAQLLTYLRLGEWQVGLLINFNVPVLKEGIKRIVLNWDETM